MKKLNDFLEYIKRNKIISRIELKYTLENKDALIKGTRNSFMSCLYELVQLFC